MVLKGSIFCARERVDGTIELNWFGVLGTGFGFFLGFRVDHGVRYMGFGWLF